MPLFIAALIGGLVNAAGTIVGKVLISLGIGYVAYTGLDTGLSWVTAQVAASFGQAAAQTLAVAQAAGVGVGLNIVLSAIAARLLLNGLTGGTIKRFVVK